MSSEAMLTMYGAAEALTNVSNPLSAVAETGWTYMTDHYSEYTITSWISIVLHELVYFGLCLPGFVAQFLPFMRTFKIQQEKPESVEGQWKCFRKLMFNHFCIQAPLVMGIFHFNRYMGIPYTFDRMPHWYTLILKLVGCLIIEDTWHYFVHQLLHHKSLYKHVHKVHHHFQAPFGMVAEYAHPVETVVLGTGFFIALLIFTDHLVFLWAWMIVRLLETIEVHSGYDFPYINPLHLIPGYAGARFHDFHHRNFTGNYASTFLWWDWLFGTDQQYRNFLEQKDGTANPVTVNKDL